MSSPAVETTGIHPLATRRELRQQRRERRLLAAVAAAILLALLAIASVVVNGQHDHPPTSGPGAVTMFVAAPAP
jgi:hypothetical protein